jgi:uncharacterized protein YndB with AHSA1/START domain
MVRQFNAPVERVYDAWTTPGLLEQWAWGSLGCDVRAELQLRVGGTYSISTVRPDQETFTFHGTYVEVVPHEKLVYTLHWDAPMGYETPEERVTVEFAGKGDVTEVTFVHEGVPDLEARREHEKGWSNTFDALETVLRG